MGGPTGAGIHLKTRDRVKVLDAVRAAMGADGLEWLGGGPDAPEEATRLLLLPARGGWLSLYPEDPKRARELGALLALTVQVPVLVVGRVEDMAFWYLGYDAKGDPVDEYHSCPDYEKEFDQADASPEELERTRGKPAALGKLLGASDGGVKGLEELLTKARIERLRDHDVGGGFVGVREPLQQLAGAFSLPDLMEDFDELWHLGQDDDEDIDLRYLAYAEPKEKSRLEKLLDRFRGDDELEPTSNTKLEDDLEDDDEEETDKP